MKKLLIRSYVGEETYIYENTPIQIYRKFHLEKVKIFR